MSWLRRLLSEDPAEQPPVGLKKKILKAVAALEPRRNTTEGNAICLDRGFEELEDTRDE